MAILVTITNERSFFALILGPGPSLVLVVEINYKKRMLEFYEEVPWVLIVVIFGLGQVNTKVSVCMCQADFIFQLFLRILYGEVLNAKISSEVFTSLDFVDIAYVLNLRVRIAERSRGTTLVRLG